jgi:predicted nucleic-acid-binding protein
MIAVDTNILIRYLTNDDPTQSALALKILSIEKEIFVAKTVLLETEWVLRSVYEIKPDEIYKAMLQILGLPNVVPETPEQIALALEYYRQGMDFADALHSVAHSEIEQFYTFDKAFVKKS